MSSLYCSRCNAVLQPDNGGGAKVIHEPSCPLVAKPVVPVLVVSGLMALVIVWFMFMQARGLA